MSNITSIQWADTTVNPIMGCGGCELFPDSGKVLTAIADAMKARNSMVKATKDSVKAIFKQLVAEAFQHVENPHAGHNKMVNTTNIWHLRERFCAVIHQQHGAEVAKAAMDAIRKSITCYAATLHLNKAANILDREGNAKGKDVPRQVKSGYAPIFEKVTKFDGRSEKTAKLKDLQGYYNPRTPWKDRLPRLIFVSDMGDAFSAKADFSFLKKDLMPAIQSEKGKKHLWLWLTKRPGRMAEFSQEIDGFPENVCAMTTLTGPNEESLKRLADIKKVNASIRGLSIEPLWDRIPPDKLNLDGIDWVILGGESGSGQLTRPFAVEWAEEIRDHCKKSGVAFFMKQMGRNPSRNGEIFRLKDRHGGEWDEWHDPGLRLREFPQAFYDYRKDEMKPSAKLRPFTKEKKSKKVEDESITPEEKADFKRLDQIVKKGINAFWEVGRALAVIKAGKLWKVGGHQGWDAYCRSVAGMSRAHAHRLVDATGFMDELKTLPRGNVLPLMEAQIRPLLRMPEPEQRAEAWFSAVEEAGGQQPTGPQIQKVVFDILHPEGMGQKNPSRAEQRQDVANRLKAAIGDRKSWEEVATLLEELEKVL